MTRGPEEPLDRSLLRPAARQDHSPAAGGGAVGRARALQRWISASRRRRISARCFEREVSDVRLEIGFGGGEHLLHEASSHPATGFIGVEPFVNSMAKMMTGLAENPLANLRVHDDDATQLLDWLPDASLAGIDLLYPDPWPKKKHWKRRFVSPVNLDRFSRVLKAGGVFRFASDIDSYVNWTLLACAAHGGFVWTAADSSD